MKSLFEQIDIKLPETKMTSERQVILSEILKEINVERSGTKWKPLTGRGIAIKVSHIPTKDLYYVKSICLDYKNRKGSFSKCFFGSLKVNLTKSQSPTVI